MHPEAGRARAFAQGQDDPEVIMEAIDTCPVNCISFVDLEDLVILEQERDNQVINQASIGVPATWSVRINAMPPTKAKLGGGGALTCCNNCPSKGCKECPMYGVGLNPIYIERMEARQAKKEASGQAQREREDQAKAESVSAIFADATYGLGEDDDFDDGYMTMPPLDGVVVPTDSTAAAATGGGLGGGGGAGGGAGGGPAAPGTDVFLAIFGDEDESLGDTAQRQAAMAAPDSAVANAAREAAAEQARLAAEARAQEERARAEERRAAEEAARRAAEAAERAERARLQAEKAEAAQRAMEAREAAEAELVALTESRELFVLATDDDMERWRWAMSKDKRLGAISDLESAQAALEEASDRAEELGVKAFVVRAARSRAEELDANRKVMEAAL